MAKTPPPLPPEEAGPRSRARSGATRSLSVDEIANRLRARFGDAVVDLTDQHGHAVATVTRDRYHEVCVFLRDEPELDCDYCDFTGGVDFGPQEGFEVLTHVFSTTHHHNVRLKVRIPYEDAVMPTVSDVWATCDWHERETREMFGIGFEGHPQPVKLLLSEPFEGHPLRKDFPLMTREAKPWPGDSEIDEGGAE